MTIFQRVGKCLAGDTNLSTLINELLLKVKILTNELRDKNYSYDLLLFHFYSNPALFQFILHVCIYIYIYIHIYSHTYICIYIYTYIWIDVDR